MAEGGDRGIRIGYAERDEAVATLGVHLSSGRLELSEYEDRCGRAAAARTRGELEALFDDLPAPHPDLSSATRPVNLVRQTGGLVRDPAGGRRPAAARTRPGSVFEVFAGVAFVFGIPAATLLTVFLGLWWVFIPVGLVLVVAGGLSDRAKKQHGP